MPSRLLISAAACLAIAAGLLAGCGSDEEDHLAVVEGEQLHLDGLTYNVAITRFLNIQDTEDSEYLVGQDPPEPGTSYLGVFLTILNQGEEELPSADGFTVISSEEVRFDPLVTESPYALPVGDPIPAKGRLPIPNSTAATGPIEGSMLVFLVDDAVSESRPLRLEIEGDTETGEVELDI